MFAKARPTRVQISQITRISAHPLPRTPANLLLNSQARLLSSSPTLSSEDVIKGVTMDQTKHDNHPSNGKKPEHEHTASSARTEAGRNHPAKQPDPQQSPERSTGFETDGPGSSEAGKGKDTGNVHQEKGEQPGKHQTWGEDK